MPAGLLLGDVFALANEVSKAQREWRYALEACTDITTSLDSLAELMIHIKQTTQAIGLPSGATFIVHSDYHGVVQALNILADDFKHLRSSHATPLGGTCPVTGSIGDLRKILTQVVSDLELQVGAPRLIAQRTQQKDIELPRDRFPSPVDYEDQFKRHHEEGLSLHRPTVPPPPTSTPEGDSISALGTPKAVDFFSGTIVPTNFPRNDVLWEELLPRVPGKEEN